jgi:energy-coupling factor transporter ATP-binding protein EcfA2
MSAEKKPTEANKTPLQMVLDWASAGGRPDWQRDALRRIVEHGALTHSDTEELVQLAKRGQGDAGVAVNATPLTASHLPAVSPGSGAITLSSITGVTGVNQLAPDQTLPFAPSGLTIVYGANGAGKSGYARVLKKVCRARFPGVIMPDAFSEKPSPPARATITYAVDGVTQTPVSWQDSVGGPHAVLSGVSVFDRESAGVHLREENQVAYRPFGLDIPDELAVACNAVKEALTREKKALETAQSPLFAEPSWSSASKVGGIMGALKADTDLAPLQALATMSPEEVQRHSQLTIDLAKNPHTAAAEHRLNADAIKQLANLLERAAAANDDAALIGLSALVRAATDTRNAANLAADTAFGGALFDGVGGAAWRALWSAAENFAAQAGDMGKKFLTATAGEPCVLCHQQLSAEAATRIASFATFVAADIETQAQAAERAAAAAIAGFDAAAIHSASIKDARQRLLLVDADAAARALRYLAAIRLRRRQCRRAIASGTDPTLTVLPASPVFDLRAHEKKLRDNAHEIAASAQGDVRAKLVAEQRDLADRMALASLLPIAEVEVARHKSLTMLGACLAETSTTAITHLGNSIADTVITPHLRDRFQDEIVQLAAERVRVEVVRSGGKYGTPHYQIRFFKNTGAPVTNVLSEGEQTCVALAAFLTELATAQFTSALVFDDPITSLDHKWRKKVAERLVKEAAVRQIVVLTHDLVFLNDLRTLAERAGTPLATVSLARGPGGAGVVTRGLPWQGKTVFDRVDTLEKDARTAQLLYDAQDGGGYRDVVHKIYSALRSTWERAVEDIAFHHVVMRHRDYVDTRNLKKVTVLSEADCDELSAHYKKCCDEIEAHDPSRGRDDDPPPPDDLFRDIAAVRTWADGLRARQKAI